jgi:hypothetical protein
MIKDIKAIEILKLRYCKIIENLLNLLEACTGEFQCVVKAFPERKYRNSFYVAHSLNFGVKDGSASELQMQIYAWYY